MYSVVITAAGSGTRAGLGYNKMLYKIDGITLIEKSVSIFANHPDFEDIIVTASETDYEQYCQLLNDYDVNIIVGGNERMDSVANGVRQAKHDTVFVHDGARVFLDDQLISRLLDFNNDYDGLSLAVKAIDTTLLVEEGKITKVLERDTLYNMQTPQVVKKNIYEECYNLAVKSHKIYTDEMSLLCSYGYRCHIVESESYNCKLTKPEDFKE